MDTVTDLACPVEAGRAIFYEQVTVDGVTWRRGDLFYIRDRYGVPRPITFQYVLAGSNEITCWSKQRFRRVDKRTQPCGYTTRIPLTKTSLDIDPVELEFRQIAADLADLGHEAAAERLLGVLAETNDADELDAAKTRAVRLRDEADDRRDAKTDDDDEMSA